MAKAAEAQFDPNRMAEELARRAAALEQQAQRYQQLEGRMKALSVTESGKHVTVSVDSNGVTTGITLSAGARGADPAALSAEIMSCLGRAQAKLRRQVTELVTDTVGADAPGAQIIAQYAERFPDDEDAPPAPPAPPTPPPLPTPPPPAPQPQEQARTRKPDRNQVVSPDDPDDDEQFYRGKSWLV